MNKTYQIWEGTRQWCLKNPGKRAAIVTPQGAFILTYEAHHPVPQLRGVEHLEKVSDR